MSKISNKSLIRLSETFAVLFRDNEEQISLFLKNHFAPEKKEKNNIKVIEILWDEAVLSVQKCINQNNLVKAKNLLMIFSNYKDTYSSVIVGSFLKQVKNILEIFANYKDIYPEEIKQSFNDFAESISHSFNNEDQHNVETLANQIDELQL